MAAGPGWGRDTGDSGDVGSSEAAARLGVSVRALQRLASEGHLGTKVGRRWVFTLGELDEFGHDQQAPSPASAGPVEAAVAGMVAGLPAALQQTPRAALVVVLARRLDGTDAARDSAALSRELRESLEQLEDDARRFVPATPSPIRGLIADVARSRADRALRIVGPEGDR